ncbi:MAG: cell division protein FtsZ [Candidatus Omnitrophota bacterium]|nr:MAG: cell division protein FtsZ [Candidatus Omnitrophota bacterium]
MVRVIEENNVETIKIKVVGIGNAGGNIVSKICDNLEGMEFIIFNTDAQALEFSKADMKIQIGEKITKGRGTGSDPEKGKFAANEDREKITETLKGTQLLFMIMGLGGGTGTGASPVIAKIAKDNGAIVIGFAITPFSFEGKKREEQAKKGLELLEKNVDTLIHIPNERLREIVDQQTSMIDAFKKVDEIITRGISSITELIYRPRVLIPIDFADICAIVENSGRGILGIGYGKGEDKIQQAANSAVDDPLLVKEVFMEAQKILISIVGSPDLSLNEIYQGMEIIEEKIPSVSRKLGVSINENLKNEVQITLLATGIGKQKIKVKETPAIQKEKVQLSLEDIDIPPSLRHKKKE